LLSGNENINNGSPTRIDILKLRQRKKEMQLRLAYEIEDGKFNAIRKLLAEQSNIESIIAKKVIHIVQKQ
jgi:hypothetical protein